MPDTREYAKGTSTTVTMPWGMFIKARVLCADGKVRPTHRISTTADSFFSVPCSVKYYDKETKRDFSVAGYLTIETMQGNTTTTEDDPAVVRFIPYTYRKNHAFLDWPERITCEKCYWRGFPMEINIESGDDRCPSCNWLLGLNLMPGVTIPVVAASFGGTND